MRGSKVAHQGGTTRKTNRGSGFAWALVATGAALLLAGTGCGDPEILENEATRQVAGDLVRQLCQERLVDKGRPIGVLPFLGRGAGARLAGDVRTQLRQGWFRTVVPMPTTASEDQINRAASAIMGLEELYASGVPDFDWMGAEQVLVGEFRWYNVGRTLVHVGVRAEVVDMNHRDRVWTGYAQGAVVEYRSIGLRVCLFALLALVVHWVRGRMWLSARMQKPTKTATVYAGLWCGAALVWLGFFYVLLQDYVFYLWKST